MCPVRVSQRKARDEHMFSALPSIAAGSAPYQHLRSAPEADFRKRSSGNSGWVQLPTINVELPL